MGVLTVVPLAVLVEKTKHSSAFASLYNAIIYHSLKNSMTVFLYKTVPIAVLLAVLVEKQTFQVRLPSLCHAII